MRDSNLRTPEEAGEKWCPMYRLAVRDARLRSDVEDNRQGRCIGDLCQDWLWDKDGIRGYCGLVGQVK